MWGDGFMLVIAALYLCAAVGYSIDRNGWMAAVMVCYALSNIAIVQANRARLH
jgi:hypothetical protein